MNKIISRVALITAVFNTIAIASWNASIWNTINIPMLFAIILTIAYTVASVFLSMKYSTEMPSTLIACLALIVISMMVVCWVDIITPLLPSALNTFSAIVVVISNAFGYVVLVKAKFINLK